MSNNAMTALAAQVPTSISELSELGMLGETVIADYGERLVKNINGFVKQEKLEKYVERRRAAKRPRKGKENDRPGPSGDDNIDEFDAGGIDFASIELPGGNASASAASAAASAGSSTAAKKSGKRSGTKSSFF